MRATDLMIGDWVECIDSTHKKKVYAQIDAIEEGQTCILVKLDNCNWFLDISFIKPIPLTPEILEKNGWKSMKNGSGDFILTKPMAGNSATITKTINGYEMSHGAFNGLGIQYIHLLQHALRLCGIEKEIDL